MFPPGFDALMDELDQLPPGDAVFDLDGTLIAGDIGETAMKWAAARGPLPAAARALLGEGDPMPAYDALDPVTQCVVAVQALAGLDEADIARIVDHAFDEGHVTARAEVCALAHAVALRHRVWVLTGSSELLGVACARRLGLLPTGQNMTPGTLGARAGVLGVRAEMVDGRITARILEPVSCSEGKVAVCKAAFAERPVFAIGDSAWDCHVLGYARVGRTTGKGAARDFPAFG